MMIVRPMLIAVIPAVVLALAGCSREQSDWKVAQAADTIEAYGGFLRKHSDAAEATEARARIEQLGEERDWQRATTSDTRETYAQFIALHPNSKWTQEARIRIENFALGPTPTPAAAATATAPAPAPAAPIPARAPAPAVPKPSVAASKTVKQADTAGGQAIQLGAFNSEAIAHAQWEKLAKRHPELNGLAPLTGTTVRDGKTLYRLRTLVRDQAAAQKICAALQHKGDACLVVTQRSR